MAISNSAPAWRRAFLRELARSGSVALAAEKCGIDRSSAYQVRRKNPAFAASWDRALGTAREKLGEGRLHHASARCGPPPRAGEDQARKRPKLRADEIVRSSKAGRPCIARVGAGRWSSKSERAFLAELNASANVRAAARAAGVSTTAVYNRRKVWPGFAEAWRGAKAEGYERIEMLMIHAATVTLDPGSCDDPCEVPEMTVEQAMDLLRLHRASQMGGKPQRYAHRALPPDMDEVRASILRKIEAIERAEAGKGDHPEGGGGAPTAGSGL